MEITETSLDRWSVLDCLGRKQGGYSEIWVSSLFGIFCVSKRKPKEDLSVKLKSYSRSKQEAEEFARDLRLQGIRGVRIGKKEKKGYPVYSTFHDELGFGSFANLNFRG